MYNDYRMYPDSYSDDTLSYAPYNIYNAYWACQYPYFENDRYIPFDDEMNYGSRLDTLQLESDNEPIELKDYGPQPFVVNIEEATKQNTNFRTGLWTGEHFQVTLMSINVDDDIGLEIHPNTDQFIRIEEGQGIVRMGTSRDRVDFQANAYDDFAIMIPAGYWHNIINTGNKPLKVYAIYAPPQHPYGVVHVTKPVE